MYKYANVGIVAQQINNIYLYFIFGKNQKFKGIFVFLKYVQPWFSAEYTSFSSRADGSSTPSQNGCLQKYGMVSARPFPGK